MQGGAVQGSASVLLSNHSNHSLNRKAKANKLKNLKLHGSEVLCLSLRQQKGSSQAILASRSLRSNHWTLMQLIRFQIQAALLRLMLLLLLALPSIRLP